MKTEQNTKTENEPTDSMPTWVLLTRYFKYSDGKQDTSSCLLRFDKRNTIKDTVTRWKNLFGEEKDFLITYQIITIFEGAKKPFLFREDANEQAIKELLK